MKSPIATLVAIVVGVLVLLGYVLPIPELVSLRSLLLGWAIILVALGSVVGIVNLFIVHWHKATRSTDRDVYSAVFLISFLLTVAAGVILGPTDPNFQQAVMTFQVPVESTLTAILGREAAYSGRTIEWDAMLNSQRRLGPDYYAWGDLPTSPTPVPGQYKFF